MFRIAICDDEPEQIEIMREHLVKAMFRFNMDMRISVFTSGIALIDSIQSNDGYEIIFLDIKLADVNGIDAAKMIREKDRKALVVFVSGRTDYVLKGYEARAFRYILKPVTEETISDVLSQAMKEMLFSERGCIRFKERGEDVKVDLDDIIYFEAQNHRIFIVCSNTTHCFYERLGELERRLADKGFVRCQKGYLVNAIRIRRIGKTEILLDNGRMLPLSSNYLRQTKDKFIMALR